MPFICIVRNKRSGNIKEHMIGLTDIQEEKVKFMKGQKRSSCYIGDLQLQDFAEPTKKTTHNKTKITKSFIKKKAREGKYKCAIRIYFFYLFRERYMGKGQTVLLQNRMKKHYAKECASLAGDGKQCVCGSKKQAKLYIYKIQFKFTAGQIEG